MKVLPAPVAIWISALGRLSRSDSSRLRIACAWAGQRPSESRSGKQMQTAPDSGHPASVRVVLLPAAQRLGPVEGEHPPRGGYRIEQGGEAGLPPGGFVAERERAVHEEGGQCAGIGGLVLAGLGFDAGQRRARFLGLDDPHRLPIHEQDVVRRVPRGSGSPGLPRPGRRPPSHADSPGPPNRRRASPSSMRMRARSSGLT